MQHTLLRIAPLIGLLLLASTTRPTRAQESEPAADDAAAAAPKEAPSEKLQIAKAAKGALQLPLPAEWKAVKPRNRIIELEFEVPAPTGEDDKPLAEPGRLTVMAAGGSIDANVARWISQFRTAEGKPPGKDDVEVEKHKASGLEVVSVDLAGTYLDKPRGPFGPTQEKPDQRLLALIVPTPKHGTYFMKLTAPAATAKAAEKGFAAMIEGLKYDAEAEK